MQGSGEDVSPEKHISRYPELKDELKALFNRVMAEELQEINLDPAAEPGKRPDVIGDFRIIREIGRGGTTLTDRLEELRKEGEHPRLLPRGGLSHRGGGRGCRGARWLTQPEKIIRSSCGGCSGSS